jgi:hypothetical protein
MKWTCEGDVRGRCGVMHRSYDAAEQHCAQDQAGVRRASPSTFPTQAYSDRRPVPVDEEAREQQAEMAWQDREQELRAMGY